MGAPNQSVCEVWATEADLCEPCSNYEFDMSTMDTALQVASDILFELSGRRFAGSCTDVVRPTGSRGCWSHSSAGYALSEITLGAYPVTAITAVKVREDKGGTLETLDSSLYRIDNYRKLVRLDDPNGNNPGWPSHQDMGQDESGDGVFFEVELSYGIAPPPAGVHAAAALACELAQACSPDSIGKCRLPKRAQSIVRQGLTVEFIDAAQFLADDLTGLYEVDLFLRTYNPAGLRRSAAVLSPDLPPRVRRAGT